MKRWVALAALGVLVFFAVGVLADFTQDRPDPRGKGYTRVVLQVATRGYRGTDEEAAVALWAACAGTIRHTTIDGPTLIGDEFHVLIEPRLGEHSRRRLFGCLEDSTLDRVLGDVLRIDHVDGG